MTRPLAGIAVAEDPVAELRRWAVEEALPLWAERGWDHARGGFIERLGRDGAADHSASRRIRVQARQIYCFASAARLGWHPAGHGLALDGLQHLLAKARSPDGAPGFIHLLSPDGAPQDLRRDAYDHAFVLLALASVYRLTGDAQVKGEIDDALGFLDEHLGSPHGGFHEAIPKASPRRQNPHMHLLESMIALFDATGEPHFRRRAADLFALFESRFFDARTQCLGEYFADDWSPIAPVCVEPGHQAEWVWLLKGYQRIAGVDTGRYRAMLLNSALRYRDASGCLVDEGDVSGAIVRGSRRCWPQTEIVKAWTATAEAGDRAAGQAARQALARLKREYLDHPVAGGWYDQFDADGRSLVDAIPASTFYHLVCAIAEADRVLGA